MKLTKSDADVFIPDGSAVEAALAKTTHLAIGAHQDDLEFMSLHGILECFHDEARWYTGVTVTDGSGSPRTGPYADYSGEEMCEVRIAEQREAAVVGGYGCQIQLMWSSAELKDGANSATVADLQTVLELACPEVVYLHNPADKHDTHVACCLRSIAALRTLPVEKRPAKVYGCEVWRDLDWMTDADKVALPLHDPDGLGIALAGVFESQIAGGKRYDLAIQGRWLANATFHESHEFDSHSALSFTMDLTPLIDDPTLDVGEFAISLLRRTGDDISDRIARMNR
jgi:LmbE family N-acetylglucosaminyl deacetylase